MSKVLVEESSLYALGSAIRQKGGSGQHKPGEMAAAVLALPGPSTLVSKSITANGSYDPDDDNADGYSGVTVNVPNSYAAGDEGKVVQSGALVAQTSANVTENGTVDTTTNNEVVVAVPGPNLGTKTIMQNGTYDAEDDSLDGYSSVNVQVAAGDAVFALIVVTFPVGESLSVTDGTVVLEADGVSSPYAFHVPSAGQWTVVSDNGSSQVSDVVTIAAKGQIENVTISRLQIVPWSTGTDEQIAAMIDAAQEGDLDLQQDGGWSIGDVRTVTISAFTAGGGVSVAQQQIDLVISSFDDYMSCGCVMQFDFKESLTSSIRMNATKANSGWGATEMKTITMPALVSALPSWLNARLVEFSVRASAGSKQSTIETVSGNKLALRSEIEIFGSRSHSYNGEGSIVPYYETPSNRVKNVGLSGSPDMCWLRGPKANSFYDFCAVSSSGSADYAQGNLRLYVAPFGCL